MILNDLKMKIITLLQESNISIEGIYYITKDIFEDVKNTYSQALENEKYERLKEISEKDNKNGPIQESAVAEKNNEEDKLE